MVSLAVIFMTRLPAASYLYWTAWESIAVSRLLAS